MATDARAGLHVPSDDGHVRVPYAYFFYRARTNQELHAGTRCRSASGYNTLRMLPSADECMVKWVKVSAINGSVPDLIRQDFVLGACTSNQNITDYRLQF